MTEVLWVLTLLNLPGIGRRTVAAMLDMLPSASSVTRLLEMLVRAYPAAPHAAPPTQEALDAALHRAESAMNSAADLGIVILGPTDPRFPLRLRRIPDAPVLLYAIGDLSALTAQRSVAVVGTREPTPFGLRTATTFGRVFAEAGFVVVSGLALGCDTAAHMGCLEARGSTTAVVAHGLDRVYPRENTELAERIVANRGCVVSEYPPGQRPRAGYFVERDRLQSGLAAAVVVVETGIRGGTMHTVRHALDQKRLLGCVAPPEGTGDRSSAAGNAQLLRESNVLPIATRRDLDDFIAKVEHLLDSPTGPEPPTPLRGGQLPLLG